MRTRTALAALLATLPLPLAADPLAFSFREFRNYCTAGAFSACASVSIRVWSTPTESFIVISFQNRQGSAYGHDNTGGSSLGFFQMTNRHGTPYGVPFPLPAEFPDDDWLRTVGPVESLGQEPGLWDATLDLGVASQWSPAGTGKGVFGCAALPIDPDAPSTEFGDDGYSGAWRTCPRDGFTGHVDMAVVIDIPSSAEDWDLEWTMTGAPGSGTSATCQTADGSTCASLTPEPGTMALLATGLAGVGCLRRRRRGAAEVASSRASPHVPR